jgi:phenylacetate-CoA ligase
MRIVYSLKRLHDISRALSILKKINVHEAWTRNELVRFQQERLSYLVRYAVLRSPFYRGLYRHIKTDREIVLGDLPIIDKATMMENFDGFVTDARIKLKDLQNHIRLLTRDEYYMGEYRVLTTSGSSGLKGVFVSNRREWSSALSGLFRCGCFIGFSPGLRRRLRISFIGANSPMHVTYRMCAGTDIGLAKIQRLEATSSIESLVDALNAFQPEFLTAYPSIASLLAVEQCEGRLNIRPEVVSTMAEVRTREMERKILEAWGVFPFNNYGMTEAGIAFGSDCSFHRGVHVFEDLIIAEVVDSQNKAVPDGSPGYKLLITNLFNYTQPLIRYEVSDMITMSTESCPCGRPLRMISVIEGRNDDIIYLEGTTGQDVPVHPVLFHTMIGSLPEIRQYQVIHDETGINIEVVLQKESAWGDAARAIKENLKRSLESLGARCPDIQVRRLERIERDPRHMGKFKIIKSTINQHGKDDTSLLH